MTLMAFIDVDWMPPLWVVTNTYRSEGAGGVFEL